MDIAFYIQQFKTMYFPIRLIKSLLMVLYLLTALGCSGSSNAASEEMGKKESEALSPAEQLRKMGGRIIRSESKPGQPVVEVVRISGAALQNDDVLAALKTFPELREIWLHDLQDVQSGDLAVLKEVSQLRRLSLFDAQNDDLAVLKQFRWLQQLSVNSNQVDDDGMVHLKSLANLEELDLSGTNLIGADGLAQFRSLKKLERLDVSDTLVNSEGVKHLAGLKSLRSLSLSGTAIDDKALTYLSTLPHLKVLELSNLQESRLAFQVKPTEKPGVVEIEWERVPAGITNVGLAHLKDVDGLEELLLVDAKITDAGLKHLSELLPRAGCSLRPRPVCDGNTPPTAPDVPTTTCPE